MFSSFDKEIPISYFGISILFIAFAVVLVISQAIIQIFDKQNSIW